MRGLVFNFYVFRAWPPAGALQARMRVPLPRLQRIQAMVVHHAGADYSAVAMVEAGALGRVGRRRRPAALRDGLPESLRRDGPEAEGAQFRLAGRLPGAGVLCTARSGRKRRDAAPAATAFAEAFWRAEDAPATTSATTSRAMLWRSRRGLAAPVTLAPGPAMVHTLPI